MGKIIKLDLSKKRAGKTDDNKGDLATCEHKYVVVYEKYRSVRCSLCRALLDPFDVLVDMVKKHVPPGAEYLEEDRIEKEEAKRKDEQEDNSTDDDPLT